MTLYAVTTSDGKTITMDHGEATPQAALHAAKSALALVGNVIRKVRGDERRTPIAVPYHAIVSIAPK